ncbi:nucleotidyltransferase domain-containing protein [Streptomyces durbertensis]|uniref:Nucleotidyltransferase domain-containing protein n=1 Tax=Streptomyces durbertensis TaxID=2448886 RepID=A0ABR6EII8_9ACTN|nr:nucleotidyltransferase domain-containing protein [Streptomyces durbertensis]MBB1245127.1 nucleotidyltransferase domain-containing protein [Streptomyces durbertensis]
MTTEEFDEGRFLDRTADRLVGLPGVEAVALGGSRAEGTHTPDSDWDLAVYYRGPFDPADLRAVGWSGEVSELGAWGGGVFNGGAWLTVEGRAVDVHYRDLDVVERELARARRGRYHREVLLFHLAGIPSYLLVAELAVNRVLRGRLPDVGAYPEALRESAGREWYEAARLTLDYAAGHARRGARTEVAGAVAVAAAQTGHAVLALRGEWVTNEKRLLDRAGLRGVDEVFDALGHPPPRTSDAADGTGPLLAALERAGKLCADAVHEARASSG